MQLSIYIGPYDCMLRQKLKKVKNDQKFLDKTDVFNEFKFLANN